MSQHCGYCNSKFGHWRYSPQGRRWCPECGAFPAEEQGTITPGEGMF